MAAEDLPERLRQPRVVVAAGPRWVLVAAGAAFLVFAFHDRLRGR